MKTITLQSESVFTSWKIEEYIAYLYLSIANADFSVAQIEMDMIHLRLNYLLKNHFPEVSVDTKFLLENLKNAVQMKSDVERLKIIDSLSKKYHLSLEIKGQIVSDLLELVHADDSLQYSEYRLMHYIEASFSV